MAISRRFGTALAATVVLVAGCGTGLQVPGTGSGGGAGAPAATLTVPSDLVGRNGLLADYELRGLGFSQVEHTSVDPAAKVVVQPENWKVTAADPAPGSRAGAGDKITLSMVKGGVPLAPDTRIVMPADLIGRNGRLADYELLGLGFAKLSHVSADPATKNVINLDNWTVTAVSPAPGAAATPATPVVVTLTKKG